MTFDLRKILEDKRALRRDLAARPIAEKLRILDALRERELAIRGAPKKRALWALMKCRNLSREINNLNDQRLGLFEPGEKILADRK